MAAPLEVVLSCDSGSQLWNCTVFDLHSGSSLLSYRGGNSSARTLGVLNGEFLLAAQLGKNFINVWEIQRKVQMGKYQNIQKKSSHDKNWEHLMEYLRSSRLTHRIPVLLFLSFIYNLFPNLFNC